MCENSFEIAFRFKLPTVKLKKMEDFFSRLYKIAGNNHLLDVIEAQRKNNVEKKRFLLLIFLALYFEKKLF